MTKKTLELHTLIRGMQSLVRRIDKLENQSGKYTLALVVLLVFVVGFQIFGIIFSKNSLVFLGDDGKIHAKLVRDESGISYLAFYDESENSLGQIAITPQELQASSPGEIDSNSPEEDIPTGTSQVTKYLYEYDDKGNLIERTECDASGVILERCVHTYDDSGNEIKCEKFNANNISIRKNTCKYDKENNKIQEMEYDSAGVPQIMWTYTYDDGGCLTESVKYNGDGILLEKWSYTYDDSGNEIMRERYIDKNDVLANVTSPPEKES